MKVPAFYDPQRVGTLFYPDVSAIAGEAESAGLRPSSSGSFRIFLFIIDMQVDFCHDACGVGSALFRGRCDFTADVVLLEGKPCAKAGPN